MISDIGNNLITWYLSNKRALPWRNTTDPYHIWVSEIILQQTRVAQGILYYERFLEAFPTVNHLAGATQEQVLKIWQGLGYYSRARNMHTAAKQIVEHYGGSFPGDYTSLLRLRGVGEYTAAAVASLAFGQPVAVVDGNVIRVISRLFDIREPVNTPVTFRNIKILAEELLLPEKPALFNQAIMEFGALHCTPQNPSCHNCPLDHKCIALKNNTVKLIPVKSQKTKIRNRFFYYLVISYNQGFYFEKRKTGDIWEGLYEFPLLESDTMLTGNQLQTEIQQMTFSNPITILHIHEPVKHILSHQKLFVTFIFIKAGDTVTSPSSWKWHPAHRILELAVPRVIDRYIRSAVFNKISGHI